MGTNIIGIAAVVILFVGIFILYFYLEKKRREALRALARQLGFNFTPYDTFGLPAMFSHLSLFNVGHSRRAKNIIYGEREGASVFIFEYYYVTGSGKNRHTHSFTVCCVNMGMNFPYLWIRREHFFDKLTSLVGFDDIDFESHEFSKQFYVKSESKKFAYEVINQKTMEFLLSASAKPYVEIYRHTASAYFKGRERPATFRYLYEFIFGLLDCIPDFVLDKYGYG